MSPISDDRRAKNELAFKHRNQIISSLSQAIMDESSQKTVPISFVCECSNMDCTDSITMSLARYKQIRERRRHFLVKRGHAQTDIETVVARQPEYAVVRKRADLPTS